mmetsp:Transcript_15025/g.35790  ORF Transcript_15025/g.35790 Transcript_15025/m.35790 type:complete len:204 (+) Transcript_15025:1646-2257(+)
MKPSTVSGEVGSMSTQPILMRVPMLFSSSSRAVLENPHRPAWRGTSGSVSSGSARWVPRVTSQMAGNTSTLVPSLRMTCAMLRASLTTTTGSDRFSRLPMWRMQSHWLLSARIFSMSMASGVSPQAISRDSLLVPASTSLLYSIFFHAAGTPKTSHRGSASPPTAPAGLLAASPCFHVTSQRMSLGMPTGGVVSICRRMTFFR